MKRKEILELVADYYHRNLKENKRALEYLIDERGIKSESIDRFKIGFANGNELVEFLERKNLLKKYARAGYISTYRYFGGKCYDQFYGRIVFPVKNCDGEIAGFVGKEPWVPHNYIEKVNDGILYCFYESLDNIKATREVILVEGPFDAIWMQQEGFTNTAALLGVVVREKHAKFLKKYIDSAVLLFDGDNIGKVGAKEAANVLLKRGIRVKIANLPESEDPDIFLKKNGRNDMENLLRKAVFV